MHTRFSELKKDDKTYDDACIRSPIEISLFRSTYILWHRFISAAHQSFGLFEILMQSTMHAG